MVLRLIGVLGDITIERTTVADESALRVRSTLFVGCVSLRLRGRAGQ
jgi:hypothetical protein